MKNSRILIDVSSLAHRAYHALAPSIPMYPVVYGLLRDLTILARNLQSANFSFFFDEGESARVQIFPAYKGNRKEDAHRSQIKEEIEILHTDILERIGCVNFFSKKGYEADDLIAFVCKDSKRPSIIVSSDTDFWQLLDGERVMIWNARTKGMMTEALLHSTYGLTPAQSLECKAISGCKADNIDGVPGIGEIYAAKYVKKRLPPESKPYDRIQNNMDLVVRNRTLVRLPLSLLTDPELPIKDQPPFESDLWDAVVDSYKLESLIGYCPKT